MGSGVQLAVRDYILPLWILCHQTPLNDRGVRELCEGLHRNTNTTILHVVEVVVILLRNCRPPAQASKSKSSKGLSGMTTPC